MNSSEFSALSIPVQSISRCDRWQVCQRLQELSIPCHCTADGFLEVEMPHPVAILQLRSVIQQITASKPDLIDWLERCWQLPNGGSLPLV